MARAKSHSNGNGRVDRLEEVVLRLDQSQANFMALMQQITQNQATFNAQMAATNARFAELEARHIEYERRTQETVQSIFKTLAELAAVVNEHTQILQALPDAIRDKMGFRPST